MHTIPFSVIDDTAAGRPARHAPAPAPQAWFEAASPFGALRLCVQANDGPVCHAAAAAVALQQAEPLLDAFDHWSLLAPDWRWSTGGAQELCSRTHVWLDWQLDGDGTAAARLELPWALLRSLPAPPDALAGALHWPCLPAAVVVARLHIDADELAALEPGGAVVLPESMRPGWHGVLRAADEPPGSGVALALTSPLAPEVIGRGGAAPDGPAEAGQAIACEVRLATARALPADRMAGWTAGALGEAGPKASLWRCGAGADAATYLASGTLLPWGDGWALALEAVHGGETRAAATKL